MAEKPEPLSALDHTSLRPRKLAVFLDFDGTLADIAERPDAVSVPRQTRDALQRLDRSTQGALAIITGRSIDEIDRFLAPLTLPVAGVHGLERRTAGGKRTRAAINGEALEAVRQRLELFAGQHPDTLLEVKPGSVALHYRRRPDLAQESTLAVHAAAEGLTGLHILHGKMVLEVKAGRATKADAVASFMGEQPFQGRMPLFAGDDVTDEDAFQQIGLMKGISIKIGHGNTVAAYRTEDTASFRRWLGDLADNFDSSH